MRIDWISGTITDRPISETLATLNEIFSGWLDLEFGNYGYECSAIVCTSGRVYWSNVRPEMGVHFSLPSSALDICKIDTVSLARRLVGLGTKFTRVDFALDDTTGILDLDVIGKHARAGHFVSRWKRNRVWEEFENGQSLGVTYSFGSRSSESYLRIYDKAAEQNTVGHWVRVELELKDERADTALKELLALPVEAWGEKVSSWLFGLLDFKIVSSDSNKSRWQTAEWWLKFLGSVKKSRLYVSHAEPTFDGLKGWIDRQCLPSLFVVMMKTGKEELFRDIAYASDRLKPKHLAMLGTSRH